MKNIYTKPTIYIVIIVISFMTRSTMPQSFSVLAYESLIHGNYEQAVCYYKKLCLQVSPTNDLICNLGYALKKCGLFHEAEELYYAVLKENPSCARAHRALSHILLAQGKFEQGWHEYEWRWIPLLDSAYRIRQHLIDNNDSLINTRILLKTEYGLGDIFQFIRYAAVLKHNGAYIIVKSCPQLIKLLSLCPYIDELHEDGGYKLNSDYEAFIMSGPLICDTNLSSIPQITPYLYADTQLTAQWALKIKRDDFNIGICWQADMSSQDKIVLNDAREKSIPLEEIIQLATIPGVKIHSLQKNIDTQTRATLSAVNIYVYENFDEEHGSFMDTAALMQHLDLIISIDTSLAHLAGALARPVWVLLPKVADWRWLTDRADSPWYPSMRLFRQTLPHNWADCINSVKHALASCLASRH